MLITLIPSSFFNIHTSPLLGSDTLAYPSTFTQLHTQSSSRSPDISPFFPRPVAPSSSLLPVQIDLYISPKVLSILLFRRHFLAQHCTFSGVLALVSEFLDPVHIVIIVISIYVHTAIELPIHNHLAVQPVPIPKQL